MKQRDERFDRFFPLAEAAYYPGRPGADMVFWAPPSTRPARIWMLTRAARPRLRIDDLALEPALDTGSGLRWRDFGIVDRLPVGEFGFAQLRIEGVNPKEAADSCVAVTGKTELCLRGSMQAAERLLLGISREDVGRTFLSPSVVTTEGGKPVTFRLIYACGSRGLPAGALLALTLQNTFPLPQTEDPAAPGYVTAACPGGKPFRLAAVNAPGESFVLADIIYELPEGLGPHELFVFTYRCHTPYLFTAGYHESDLRYWYSLVTPFTATVSVDGGKVFVPTARAQSHSLSFRPGPPEWLHLFLPGRRRRGEPVKLVGIVTDAHRNTAQAPMRLDFRLEMHGTAGLDLALDGPAGRWTAAHRFETSLPELPEGVYRVRAVDTHAGAELAVSNPLEVLAPDDPRQPLYWGEIHGHSEMSDGINPFGGMLEHARDVACLDFAAGADHACYFSDNEWELMQDITNALNEPGAFCTLVGYEWAGKQGHRNIYTSGSRLELFRGMYAPTHDVRDVWRVFHGRADLVGGPHREHTQDFWDGHDPTVVRFVEIYAVSGWCEELAHRLLNEGALVGFLAGGDSHVGRCHFSPTSRGDQGRRARGGYNNHSNFGQTHWKCGITAAVCARLDRDCLVAALRGRQTYATSGARILVDFTMNKEQMGGVADAEDGINIVAATIHACDDIARIEIVRNGDVAVTLPGTGRDQSIRWEDENAPSGRLWYYLRVIQSDGEAAWTSPIWFGDPGPGGAEKQV